MLPTDYQTIYQLVVNLDRELAAGRVHYRNRAGRLLTQLDEVVNAILAHNLQESAYVTPDQNR